MTAALQRRRPAVSPHPLAAVPAATCIRQLPLQPLGRGAASDIVHALVDDLTRTLCRTRVRRLDMWDGTPLRLCSLCAAALGGRHLGPFWQPARVELAELHLHAADQVTARLRESLADIRSAAIADGSALLPVDQVPAYRTSRGIADTEPPAPLHATVILGQLLDRMAPVDATVQAARVQRAAAERQRLTDRLAASSADRRADLRAARQAKRR